MLGLVLGVFLAVPIPAPPERPASVPAAKPGLSLDVLVVNDPDFAPLTARDAQVILDEARGTMADKFRFAELTFRMKGAESVAEYFAKRVKPDDPCLAEMQPLRARPGEQPASAVPRDPVLRFLSRWTVEKLQAFFPPEQREGMDTHDKLADRLLAEFDRKLQKIAAMKLKNGESLLAPSKLDLRSYVRWICAIRNQDDADLILTNAFILYDLASEPYPHTVFYKLKIGGASLSSPKRQALRRRAVVASTFSMIAELPFYQEEGADRLSSAEQLKVIGSFILAHELGHALFKIPDFFDHPRQCLMTTKYESNYVSGYQDIKQFPGPCDSCQPYVSAKRHVFSADQARARRDWLTAMKELGEAIKTTPSHVDGVLGRYLLDLSNEASEVYQVAGKPAEAKPLLEDIVTTLKTRLKK